MSLLDNMPHLCTIRHRATTQGTLGKGKPTPVDDSTGVSCWEQPAGASEINLFQKRGMNITHNVFFASEPDVNARYEILVTHRWDDTTRAFVAVSSPKVLEVISKPEPDDSAGMGVLWKVVCNQITSRDD